MTLGLCAEVPITETDYTYAGTVLVLVYILLVPV